MSENLTAIFLRSFPLLTIELTRCLSVCNISVGIRNPCRARHQFGLRGRGVVHPLHVGFRLRGRHPNHDRARRGNADRGRHLTSHSTGTRLPPPPKKKGQLFGSRSYCFDCNLSFSNQISHYIIDSFIHHFITFVIIEDWLLAAFAAEYKTEGMTSDNINNTYRMTNRISTNQTIVRYILA